MVALQKLDLRGTHGTFPAAGEIFYRVRFDLESAQKLRDYLAQCTDPGRWYNLLATGENPNRLRPKKVEGYEAPAYERAAQGNPLREAQLSISGNRRRACNIDFSGRDGAQLLRQRVEQALGQARRFVELRVLEIRRRRMFVVLADTEIEVIEEAEHKKLGQTGAALAAGLTASEDFADWEAGRK